MPKTQKTIETPMSMYRGLENSKRSMLYGGGDVFKPSSYPRILLVDDDPIFGKIVSRSAHQLGASVTYCENITDFGKLSDSWNDFDVAVIDCNLGFTNGYELVDYMEHYTKKSIPVVLVSQTKQDKKKRWPTTIREFIHKKLGPFAVLNAAFEAYEISKIYEDMELTNKKKILN